MKRKNEYKKKIEQIYNTTMQKYLSQLIADIQAATLNRWRIRPPHFYEMGMPDQWLNPPEGYNGPPLGYGHDDNNIYHEGYMAQLEHEKVNAEIEHFLANDATSSMFDYFELEHNQFPPVDRLQDEQLQQLCDSICRLWSAYNYTPVIPEKVPARILYPILVDAMLESRTQVNRGNIGIEFCNYYPETCPFGKNNCSCADML